MPHSTNRDPQTPRLDVLTLVPRFGAGGAARVACILSNALAAEGVSAAVVTLDRRDGRLNDAVAVHSLPAFGGGRGPLSWMVAMPRLVRLLRESRPVTFLSAGNHANLFAAIAHRLAGRPEVALVLKLTNPILRREQNLLQRPVRAWAHRWMMDRASAVLVLSPEDEAAAAAVAPAAAAKLRVVTNPYLAQQPVTRCHEPESGPPLVLAVGRLTRQKNFELLLTALAKVRGRPWRLAVLGQGKQATRLAAAARRLEIADRVDFVGHTDPGPYYRRARMLALSSRWEGLPAVAVEALASGCPVVATDCSPALSRLVRNSGAGVVTDQTADALADALAEVLDWSWRTQPAAPALAYGLESGVQSHKQALQAIGLAHRRLKATIAPVLAAAQ